MRKTLLFFIAMALFAVHLSAQKSDANVFGDVQSEGEHVPFANVFIKGTNIGTTTDETGHYMLVNLPVGKHVLVANFVGYKNHEVEIEIVARKSIEVNFEIKLEVMRLDEVVVTGTKTFQRQTEAPVIVNVLDSKTIKAVQACNISEGLRFQPGLRVETDCQTCNYTQLRMNGLGGGYSQILINGRPIFSPLIGLYGMEQIPANMVDCIEVVRGGGSALYGSSAIGGTVNVITQMPKSNAYDLSFTSHSINGEAQDNVLNGNISVVNPKRNAGAVFFVNNRNRDTYDHQGISLLPDGSKKMEKDNFSELPKLSNNSFGANLFYKPTLNQKIELNFTSLYEYRYGGEMIDKQAHLAQQSEERLHNILMGGIDYQINFNDNQSSFIAYFAGQQTDRDHYTGLFPVRDEYETAEDFDAALYEHLSNPPYGKTTNATLQGGLNMNHRFNNFVGGTNVVTAGVEYLFDEVLDSIPQYKYGIDQQTKNFAGFLQSDWQINPSFTLLMGLRADKHNLVDHTVFSPRVSLLYRLKSYTQFRLTLGTGFRAPQAFDTDMHLAFSGGGTSHITLDPNLKEERSNSISGSINFDQPKEHYILGFTLEGFYTRLDDAFYLQPLGADDLGERYEKRNGQGATVQGFTIEVRANYDKKIQLNAGITLQKSEHDEAIFHIDSIAGSKKEFLRSPNQYGYTVLTFTPGKNFNASINGVLTGPMLMAKFSPNESLEASEYRNSPSFAEFGIKLSYTFPLQSVDTGLELYGGIKNITNIYQDDFDNYRNRDSNYI